MAIYNNKKTLFIGLKGEKGDKGEDGMVSLNQAYPVGSVYINALNPDFDPNIEFGGGMQWIRLTDCFLFGYNPENQDFGSTGGEKEHTLKIDEMPSHNHELSIIDGQNCGYWDPSQSVGALIKNTESNNPTESNKTGAFTDRYKGTYGNQKDGFISYNGSNKSHNNMPPYKVVAFWVRIS